MSMLGPTKTGKKVCGTQNLATARLDMFWRGTVWLVWYDIHCSQAVAHLQACLLVHIGDLVMMGKHRVCLCKSTSMASQLTTLILASHQPTLVWVGQREVATQLEAGSLFPAMFPPDLISSNLHTCCI